MLLSTLKVSIHQNVNQGPRSLRIVVTDGAAEQKARTAQGKVFGFLFLGEVRLTHFLRKGRDFVGSRLLPKPSLGREGRHVKLNVHGEMSSRNSSWSPTRLK